MRSEKIGFMVFDNGEEWQQPLRLEFGPGLPERGILSWCDGKGRYPLVFLSRADAKAAIARTDAYGRAVERPGLHPTRGACHVVAIEREVAKGGAT